MCVGVVCVCVGECMQDPPFQVPSRGGKGEEEGKNGGKKDLHGHSTHPDGHIVKGIVNWLTFKAISVEPAPSTKL